MIDNEGFGMSSLFLALKKAPSFAYALLDQVDCCYVVLKGQKAIAFMIVLHLNLEPTKSKVNVKSRNVMKCEVI